MKSYFERNFSMEQIDTPATQKENDHDLRIPFRQLLLRNLGAGNQRTGETRRMVDEADAEDRGCDKAGPGAEQRNTQTARNILALQND